MTTIKLLMACKIIILCLINSIQCPLINDLVDLIPIIGSVFSTNGADNRGTGRSNNFNNNNYNLNGDSGSEHLSSSDNFLSKRSSGSDDSDKSMLLAINLNKANLSQLNFLRLGQGSNPIAQKIGKVILRDDFNQGSPKSTLLKGYFRSFPNTKHRHYYSFIMKNQLGFRSSTSSNFQFGQVILNIDDDSKIKNCLHSNVQRNPSFWVTKCPVSNFDDKDAIWIKWLAESSADEFGKGAYIEPIQKQKPSSFMGKVLRLRFKLSNSWLMRQKNNNYDDNDGPDMKNIVYLTFL